MKPRTEIPLALLALLACASPAPAGHAANGNTAPHRNVLLIIGDDMGVAQFAPYVNYYNDPKSTRTDDDMAGVTPPSTPTIEALAEAGVTFMNAWSSPLCSATRAGIFTGLYSVHNGIYGALSSSEEGLVPASSVTLAEVLGDAGYENALFGKWHLGTHYPVEHGWDWFSGALDGYLDDYRDWTKTMINSALRLDTVDYSPDDDAAYATFVNVQDALSWIRGRSRLWMATVAFNAAHEVDASAPTLLGQEPPTSICASNGSTEEVIYEDTISCMDAQIAELLSGIPADVMKNTTIIFVGDNGPESDYADFSRFAEDAKASVYEGGVAVPLIIADGQTWLDRTKTGVGPGRVAIANRRSFALVHVVDLFRTIAEIAGADGSSGSDSRSLIPILENTSSSVRTYSFTQGGLNLDGDGSIAVRNSTYKLLYLVSSGALGHTTGTSCELYDLSRDRWERTNLSGGAFSLAAFNAKVVLSLQMFVMYGKSCP